MSVGSAIRAGQAYVELSLRDNKFIRALTQAEKKLRAFGTALQKIGGNVLGAGALAAAPLGIAAQDFAQFEQEMANVKAVSRATEKDFARLWKEAKRLGAETVFTAKQAAEAMSVFAYAGLTAEEMLGATAPTLQLAAAGQIGMADAANITLKIMKAMQVPLEQIPHSMDVLVKAMITANTDLHMLGDAFKYVGPMADLAGLSLEEITAAIQILSDAGIQGDMAGTTLRGAILSLTQPSSGAKKLMASLGIQVSDAQGRFRSLTDIVGQFSKIMKGMGSAKQLEIIGTLFDARQAAGFARLVSQGPEVLEEKTKSLMNSTGTAARVSAIQLDTLTGSWKLLVSAVEGLLITVGGKASPVLRGIGDVIVIVTNLVNGFAEKNGELVKMWAIGAIAAIAIGAAIVAVGVGAQVAAFAVGGFVMALGAVGAILSGLMAALGFILSPIGAIVAGLVGLGYLWVSQTESGTQAAKAIGTAFGSLGETLASVWSSLSVTFQEISVDIGEAWKVIVDRIKSGDMDGAMKVAAAGIKRIWSDVLLQMSKGWNKFIRDIFDTLRKNPWLGPLIGGGVGGLAGLVTAGPAGMFVGGTAGAFAGSAASLITDDLETVLSTDLKTAEAELKKAKAELEKVVKEMSNIETPPTSGDELSPPKPFISPGQIKTLLEGMKGAISTPFAEMQLGVDSARNEELDELKKLNMGVNKINQNLQVGD